MPSSVEIISAYAKDRVVEDIIKNLHSGEDVDNLKDLGQDIYISLMEKEPSKIEELYSKNQLKFFITRMVTNNIFSKNSPYYQTFKKNIGYSISELNDVIDDD